MFGVAIAAVFLFNHRRYGVISPQPTNRRAATAAAVVIALMWGLAVSIAFAPA